MADEPEDIPRVTLGHGAGGRLTHALIRELFAPRLRNEWLETLSDAAICRSPGDRLALTTDGFVVDPLVFPGGDIGSLAVHGTVNDLAVAGAVPCYLTLGVILEEGVPLALLRRVVESIGGAARAASVAVVAGDTKVVERGRGHGIFLTTAGCGAVREGYPRVDRVARPGDAILVSGPLGDHGAVVLASRQGIGLQSELKSDCAAVTPLVDALFTFGTVPFFLRDPTRGGLAGVLADLAGEDEVEPACGVEIVEDAIPIRAAVRAIAEITGVDPLHLACEGRVVAVVAPQDAERALAAWRSVPGGEEAALVGRLTAEHPGRAVMRTPYGGARLLLRPTAELLPRIC